MKRSGSVLTAQRAIMTPQGMLCNRGTERYLAGWLVGCVWRREGGVERDGIVSKARPSLVGWLVGG